MASTMKNAARGAEKVIRAFLDGRKAKEGSRQDYKPGVARYATDGSTLLQWGNRVAWKTASTIEISDAGWKSVTTRAVLNAILTMTQSGAHISQKSHEWFIVTREGTRAWPGTMSIVPDPAGGSTVKGNPRHLFWENARVGPVVAAEKKWADAILRKYSAFKSFDELVASHKQHGYTPTMRFPGSAILRSLFLRATGTRAHGTQDYGAFPRKRPSASENPKRYRHAERHRLVARHVFAKSGGKEYDISGRKPISGRVPWQEEAMKKMTHGENKGVLFVNVYDTYREYGGPEEGGWYYDVGHPTGESYVRRRMDSALDLARKIRAKLKADGAEDVSVRVEQHKPRKFPQGRPHYENNSKRSRRNPAGDQFVLGSSPMIHAPGLVRWIMHGYATSSGKQKKMFSTLLGQTWKLPAGLAFAVTTGKVPYRVEGENVIVVVPGTGKKTRVNPLSRKEAARALGWAKGNIEYGKKMKGYPRTAAMSFGRARGVAGVVRVMGPKAATAVASKMGDRADLAADLYLKNGFSCLKNLHTAREQSNAKRLIEKYWVQGKAALVAGRVERAAHAYGALAAIRRLARFESPKAQVVWNLASFRMDLLRRNAKDLAKYRSGAR